MSDLMERDSGNSEGYCKKCRAELDITGICLFCALREMEKRGDAPFRLRDVLTCKICGQPKYHSRLYGYRCWNPEHNRDDV